jgi:lactoylglutathione lyase
MAIADAMANHRSPIADDDRPWPIADTMANDRSPIADKESVRMKLTGVVPNIFTTDVARATAFYRDVLGFGVTMTVPEAAPFVFVLLQRDDVTVYINDLNAVHADAPTARVVVGNAGVGIFIQLSGVAEVWDTVRQRAPVLMPLKDQWYGMTEFTVADPDGNLVTFAERKG